MEEAEKITRRSALNYLLTGGFLSFLGTIFYPVVRFVMPPKLAESGAASLVVVGKVDDFSPNSGRVVRFGTRPALVVRTPGGEFRAFIAVCTHLQCTVQYRSDLEHVWCACHNGHFDLFGKNIAGPPPRPLEPLSVAVRGEEVVVSRKA